MPNTCSSAALTLATPILSPENLELLLSSMVVKLAFFPDLLPVALVSLG